MPLFYMNNAMMAIKIPVSPILSEKPIFILVILYGLICMLCAVMVALTPYGAAADIPMPQTTMTMPIDSAFSGVITGTSTSANMASVATGWTPTMARPYMTSIIKSSMSIRNESTYPNICCISPGTTLLLNPPENIPRDKNSTEKFCMLLLWFFHVLQPVLRKIGSRFMTKAATNENGTIISATVRTKPSSEFILKNMTTERKLISSIIILMMDFFSAELFISSNSALIVMPLNSRLVKNTSMRPTRTDVSSSQESRVKYDTPVESTVSPTVTSSALHMTARANDLSV